MRVILDTNVVVSGLFFGGIPGRILELVVDGTLELIVTPTIFEEYFRTCDRLSVAKPGLEYQAALATLIGRSTLMADPTRAGPITEDADDDKFVRSAHEAGAVVVSGDRHLFKNSSSGARLSSKIDLTVKKSPFLRIAQ